MNIIFGSEEIDLKLIYMIVFIMLLISLLRVFLFLINIIFVFLVKRIEDGKYILVFVKWEVFLVSFFDVLFFM